VDRLKEEFDVDVEWKGFELNPETPKEGKMRVKESISENVKRLAEEVNLTFNPRSIISNSKLSLKTGEFAKKKNKFEEYHEATFKAYFQDTKDIGNINVIKKIIEKIDLDKTELKKYLNTNEADKILDRYKIEAKKDGIYAVPTFIVGNKKIIGVQPYNIIRKVIETN
jgi:predicted DsbA family dithiol-disulfide isomerase